MVINLPDIGRYSKYFLRDIADLTICPRCPTCPRNSKMIGGFRHATAKNSAFRGIGASGRWFSTTPESAGNLQTGA